MTASRNLGQLQTHCSWKSQECLLTIHNELGFILTDRASGLELWKQPFHNLCASNDDGAKLLWLQFRGHNDEDELVLQSANPKVLVFILHNFLSAKLYMMGPVLNKAM